ncbi:hypothetical protein TNCV_3008671 [Trichonephila clavipes]|nr:hypothetical protein TNCV_3008671 [Trichonephila clavipes]
MLSSVSPLTWSEEDKQVCGRDNIPQEDPGPHPRLRSRLPRVLSRFLVSNQKHGGGILGETPPRTVWADASFTVQEQKKEN